MTEPTDEQLDELWDEIGGYYNLYPEVRNTIREALNRWGTLEPIALKEGEPTDTEILEFLLNQFQSHSLQMNGQSSYRFMNDGFPMNRAKGPNARDAVIVAMREQQESMRKLEEKYPGWSKL